MPTIVGVRFKPTGKTYYFDPCDIQFEVGEGAIVETSRGLEFSIVSIANKEVPDSQIVGELKPVKSKATKADFDRHEQNLQRKNEIMRIVREKIDAHGLDMHLKDMDFSYDNSKMTFYYSADDRVDFRDLVKDLGSALRVRVELRQIGIRDETKMLGGLGSCGRPCCCSSFLNGFERVSIKMAKVQGLSLNPVNISGLCGRLMCCLKYENEHYVETSKLMPKVNGIVKTPDGEGKVDSVDNLRRTVKVEYCDDTGMKTIKTYNLADLGFDASLQQGEDGDIALEGDDISIAQENEFQPTENVMTEEVKVSGEEEADAQQPKKQEFFNRRKNHDKAKRERVDANAEESGERPVKNEERRHHNKPYHNRHKEKRQENGDENFETVGNFHRERQENQSDAVNEENHKKHFNGKKHRHNKKRFDKDEKNVPTKPSE